MKKTSKIIAVLLSFILISCVFFGCGNTSDAVLYESGMTYTVTTKAKAEKVISHSFDVIGGSDVMPIAGFHGPYKTGGSIDGVDYPNFLDEEYIKMLAEAGINTIVYASDRVENATSDIEKMLQLGEKYGMGFYLNMQYLEDKIGGRQNPELLSDLNFDEQELYDMLVKYCFDFKYSSLLGFWYMDELFPHNQMLNAIFIKEKIDKFNLPIDIYSNAINPYEGEYDFWATCTPTTYDDYLELYKQLNLKMFSATYYPFARVYKTLKKDSLTEEESNTAVKEMLPILAEYMKISNENDMSFWRFLEVGAQFEGSATTTYTTGPSEGEFLFNGNISLAYGCKAIQYFVPIAFGLDQLNTEGGYDFDRNAMIGFNGKKNKGYYYAQKLNEQIAAVDHVLMNAKSMGIMTCGNYAKELAKNIEGNAIHIDGTKWRQLINVTGDDCFIGCFDYLGGTAYYVVNASRNYKATTTLKFDGNYCYDVIQRGVTTTVVATCFDLQLQPGEGTLITLR